MTCHSIGCTLHAMKTYVNEFNNGKISSMEDTSKANDVSNDVDELSSGSVVYVSGCGCNDSTNCVCIDSCGCNDGGVCCMDGT